MSNSADPNLRCPGPEFTREVPAKRAPCKEACPAGIDVPRYLRFITEGKFAEAYAVNRQKIPFVSVCGHICSHPCEINCHLHKLGRAIPIRALKRFVTETGAEVNAQRMHPSILTGIRIAIIGSGPAGLTAAYYLARRGHSITVFEKSSQPGGLLTTGIPRFLLPWRVLQQEIETVLSTGIELKLNNRVKISSELFDTGYNAVLIAGGAGEGQALTIPGADFEGVLVGLSFLLDFNEGKEVKLGKQVVVIGGGNAACDVARAVRRLGAAETHLVCLESRANMPAFPWEIEEAEREGVIIHPSRTVVKIVGSNNHVTGVECLKLRWMEFDEEGRLHLDPITGSEHIFDAATVIFAIGQQGATEFALGNEKILVSKRRTIVVNPDTLETGWRGVFAAGDVTSGPASVIEAIAAGKKAAGAIDRYLGGTGDIEEDISLSTREEVRPLQLKLPVPVGVGKRAAIPSLPVDERLRRCVESELTLDEAVAREQAERCLRCDLPIVVDSTKCKGCFLCQFRCSLRLEGVLQPSKAAIKIHRTASREGGPMFDISFTDKCDTCGLCVKYCPSGALIR